MGQGSRSRAILRSSAVQLGVSSHYVITLCIYISEVSDETGIARALGGGYQCRLSGLINGNVPCRYSFNFLSILEYPNVTNVECKKYPMSCR